MATPVSGSPAWLDSDWDDYLLDILLFGWMGWAAIVILVVNAVLTFFGPLQPRMHYWDRKEGASGASAPVHVGAESCQWLNSALNWIYLHYDRFPEFVDTWVKALNEQVAKLGHGPEGPVQVKFERVKPGSLPPKFSEVTFEAGPEDKYDLNCKVDSRDLEFALFASQQTAEGVKLTNLTASILKLKGSLKWHCYRDGQDMMTTVGFVGRPDIKAVGKPVNPYQDPNDLVDISVVETVVRNAISLASATFNITRMVTGSSNNFHHRPADVPRSVTPRNEIVFEPIKSSEQQSAFHAPPLLSTPTAVRPARPTPADKRLLVKVIKASGLTNQGTASLDPACVVFLDQPPQSQSTSVVRSTLNPFWDEQFLFETGSNSKVLKFEIIDRRKTTGENFLGEAIVYFEDLKKMPSSRQILPLQGNYEMGLDSVTGSITVEFLFVDSSDSDLKLASSPKRIVEINQSKTPSGVVVTTETMVTERNQGYQHTAAVDEHPHVIQKRDYSEDNLLNLDTPLSNTLDTTDISVASSTSDVLIINGVDSVAETAIKELRERSAIRKARPQAKSPKTSTLIITGVKRVASEGSFLDKYDSTRTSESSPTSEFLSDTVPTVTTHPPSPGSHHEEKEKKKSTFAQTLKKRFSRSKKRSRSVDRSASLRDDSYLRPPNDASGPKSKDDIDLVRGQAGTPNLKKSRSLGGSLKKLFRRGRQRSRSRGDASRDSSYSRNASQGPSREGSLGRGQAKGGSLPRNPQQPSQQTPQQSSTIGQSHWTRNNSQGEPGSHPAPPQDTVGMSHWSRSSVEGQGKTNPNIGRSHWSKANTQQS